MRFNEKGQEVPDPVPVAVPHNWSRPLSLAEQIQRFVRTELSQRAALAEQETFEEADDFDVDEDPDPLSAYEIREAPVEWPGGVKDDDATPVPPPGEKSPVEAVNAPERHP